MKFRRKYLPHTQDLVSKLHKNLSCLYWASPPSTIVPPSFPLVFGNVTSPISILPQLPSMIPSSASLTSHYSIISIMLCFCLTSNYGYFGKKQNKNLDFVKSVFLNNSSTCKPLELNHWLNLVCLLVDYFRLLNSPRIRRKYIWLYRTTLWS